MKKVILNFQEMLHTFIFMMINLFAKKSTALLETNAGFKGSKKIECWNKKQMRRKQNSLGRDQEKVLLRNWLYLNKSSGVYLNSERMDINKYEIRKFATERAPCRKRVEVLFSVHIF